jgi:hypothetical protein
VKRDQPSWGLPQRPGGPAPEAAFDRLARLARRVLGARLAMVSIVEVERQ